MEKCKYICSKIGTEYDFTATKSVDIEAIKTWDIWIHNRIPTQTILK